MAEEAPPRINLPGVPRELAEEIEARIEEFEREHEADVARGGPGWVPRVRPWDYALGGVVSAGLDPWTWTSRTGWFPSITAGVPSFIVAFVVYAVVMRVWVMKALEAKERPPVVPAVAPAGR